MLGSRFCVRTVSGVGSAAADHTNAASTARSVPSSVAVDFSPLHLSPLRSRRRRSILISCDSSRRRSSSGDSHDNNNDYLEASLLLSETFSHYHMWKHRFQPEFQWKSSTPSIPLSRTDNTLLRHGFLQRFKNPTIFLRISCDGDYILPIVVGQIAIEKLMDAESEHESVECPDQYQFVENLVGRLDHEPGKTDLISVDARPSDAINVANRCKAAIYVSKEIVFTDAIRIGYGMGGVCNKKTIYDVLLDSAVDGPDLVAQELSMMHNMRIAIKQERFKDAVCWLPFAAIWRDKLANLRKSAHEL
ncbi:Ankyrin repeat domain-containing protein, chloroplastic isoform E [Glycine soja]|uniref:Ankyrin repeat domain-containing protein, chloroplastic isoform E n=1 Tax=Glycine soja TaxID=3848 RepID=A0A445M3W4_GLYSO|nr:Ankyrin repeat domain-containing protein, chloroplastic isoform E [Glycine soja]